MTNKTKKKILERDKHQCQLDRYFGISEISGISCSKRLEIHHKTYERINNNKELMKDGITICLRCHEFLTNLIRDQRYSKREIYIPKELKQDTPIIKIKEKKHAKVSMQDCRNYSPNYAQGRDGRSLRPFYKRDQEDFKKKDEDRGRL